MLLLFKRHSVSDSEYVRERFFSVIQYFTGVDKDRLGSLVDEYEGLYNEYFALRGTEHCLAQYTKISLAMEDMYSPYNHGFTEAFPAKLHR